MPSAPPPPARPGLTRFAQRGSARLAYEPAFTATDRADRPGQHDPPVVPTILLLHDLLADRSALAPLRDALRTAAPDPYRSVLPDARGHGASPAFAARRVHLADLAADALAVLDAEDIARAHVVGHGLGAATALALARLAPSRVGALVLVEPDSPGVLAADPRPAARAAHAGVVDRYRAAADLADREQTDRALDLLLDPRWGVGWRDRLPRPRLAAVRRHAGALFPLLSALAADALSPNDVASVAAPVLLVTRPDPTPLDAFVADRLVAALPNVRVAPLPARSDPDPDPDSSRPPPAALLAPLLLRFLGDTGSDLGPP